MKNFIKFTFFVLTFLVINLHSQVMQAWVARYNGPGTTYDAATSIAVDNFRNIYVTGKSENATNYDYATIKYDSMGVQQWIARYNGPGNGNDIAFSIALDNSGNVYITGESENAENYDYATIKYNSSGIQQWVTRYNAPENENDVANSIAVDGSGNVYVSGLSRGSGTNDDYATIKYNSSGVEQWVQRYNGPGNFTDFSYSLALDNSGNVYVTGFSSPTGVPDDFDYATIKYNSSGAQQWVQRYNGPGNGVDIANSIALDGSGNVYVTGHSLLIGTNEDFATIKYNSSGIQQWVARYNSPGNYSEEAKKIALDGSGNVYVTGFVITAGSNYDYETVKYNSSGIQQWVQTYNGPGNGTDISYSLAVDDPGNVFITGYSIGSGTNEDYATIKYNTSGVQQWVQRYNAPGNGPDKASALAIDNFGNVYVTGSSNQAAYFDFATIKYSPFLGIQQISTEVPKSYSLAQNYPNPFNPSTKIKFDIPSVGNGRDRSAIQIAVYDISGKLIETIVDLNLKPGRYEVTWSAANYSSGVYFYKLLSGDYVQTMKMILVK